MRLYAFLLVAGAALCARAASIPVAETEKKIIDIVPDNLDKLPENTSSEQEQIDQANNINDVDNKLRAKPENIPVEVIVEKLQPALDNVEEDDEEINRPVPDLRNPGPPQRQEHETQNPEFYANEQQTVTLFKKGISDAQNVLNQGFQGIADGIKHIVATNEPIETIQLSIQSLRDSFTSEIVKVNGTIQSYLNSENAINDKPAVEQTKAGFHQIEQGLFKLRNDFNRGVSVLTSGVDVVASLKADENAGSTTGTTSATTPPSDNFIMQIVNGFQSQLQNGMQNLQNTIDKFSQNWNQPATVAPSAGTDVPAGAQADPQVTSAPATSPTNGFPSFPNPFANIFNLNQGQIQNQIQQGPSGIFSIFQQQQPWQPFQNLLNYFNNNKTEVTTAQPVQSATKPDAESTKPSETSAQTDAVTPAGPVRQILQNNPITQGIAGAVQRLQNINNPEKPRDEKPSEQVKNLDEDRANVESKKGGGPNTGDNNDSSNSSDRVEQPEEVKQEVQIVPEVQKVPEVQQPEVQKATENEIKEHKTQEVVDKTE